MGLETPVQPIKTQPRPSRACVIRRMTYLALAGIFIGENIQAVKDIPQPERFSRVITPDSTAHPPSEYPLTPDADMEHIFSELRTAEDVSDFLGQHSTHRDIESIADFWENFRQAPRDFQSDEWTGPCNNFAEFTAQWAYLHGGEPYIISLWPNASGEGKIKHSWHQITACRIEENALLIFDNARLSRFTGSLENYVTQEYPEHCIPPLGGIIPWKLAQENTRAKLFQHFRRNAEELTVAPVPLREDDQPLIGNLASTEW